MDEVVRQAAVWYGRFGEAGPVVNLNISPVQFATTDMIADLDRLVRQHRLPASRICIELTESAVTDDVAVAALREARQLGFGVAMDDFGIGYSSLSRLPRLPLVAVKLDRSFVVHAAENDGDATLLRGIVTLAHRLKLKVIAEGVSTRAQYDLLAECQCDAAQGFLFARPMPASEVEALFQVRDGEDDGRQAVLF